MSQLALAPSQMKGTPPTSEEDMFARTPLASLAPRLSSRAKTALLYVAVAVPFWQVDVA